MKAGAPTSNDEPLFGTNFSSALKARHVTGLCRHVTYYGKPRGPTGVVEGIEHLRSDPSFTEMGRVVRGIWRGSAETDAPSATS